MANSTSTLSSAIEGSTYIVKVSFYDSAGDALIPSSITWSLYNSSRRIINSRTAVSIAVPAAENNIVLGTADLTISDSSDKLRIMKINAVYDSTTYGNNLPLKAAVKFTIDEVV